MHFHGLADMIDREAIGSVFAGSPNSCAMLVKGIDSRENRTLGPGAVKSRGSGAAVSDVSIRYAHPARCRRTQA
jgi:hypothetical protein